MFWDSVETFEPYIRILPDSLGKPSIYFIFKHQLMNNLYEIN